MEKDPNSVVIGAGASIGSQDWMKSALLAQKANVDPHKMRYVAAIFAIIVFSRRKDWPSLYHSLGRQTYTLRHYRTDVPPDLMN
ncbi:hypothetical protein MJM25_30000, partial [Salmonella enterica subsp. enterica serovar Lubbock]|nr:hypothetical protein [Salmonella enterica subsp. enterica serovar Lubbock]